MSLAEHETRREPAAGKMPMSRLIAKTCILLAMISATSAVAVDNGRPINAPHFPRAQLRRQRFALGVRLTHINAAQNFHISFESPFLQRRRAGSRDINGGATALSAGARITACGSASHGHNLPARAI